MSNTLFRSQTERLSASAYPWVTFKTLPGKDQVLVDASSSHSTSVINAFNAMRDSIVANLNAATVFRIKIIVETNEVAP